MMPWRVLLLSFLGSIFVATVPHRFGRHRAGDYLDGLDAPRALARGVDRWLDHGLSPEQFTTGRDRFDGEWLFGTYVMAALGFGQLARSDAEERGTHLAAMDRALDALEEPATRRFDRQAWGEDGLAALDGDRGHVALLGYWGLALALRRDLGPSRHDRRETAVVEGLRRRLAAKPGALVETYPGEIYPVDNASAVGALALHARTLGAPRPAVVTAWLERLPRWRDPETGLLIQAVGPDGVTPRDAPRGSGTALAAYFLSFADEATSRSLYEALRRELYDPVLGFGAVREHPAGVLGQGDIDSGPLVFGYSVSATGFALASARIHGDRRRFEGLYATAHLFGVPRRRSGSLGFVTGGPLGDAILLAMLTAGAAS